MCLTRLSRVGVGGGGGGGSGRSDGWAREHPDCESVSGAARNPPCLIESDGGRDKAILEEDEGYVNWSNGPSEPKSE